MQKVLFALCLLSLRCAAEDWAPLFDGKSLTGWRWDKPGEHTTPSWEAREGMLCTTPGRGNEVYLLTEQEFEDFELRFEWYSERGGNSGIKYRIQAWGNSARRLEPTGLEYQITDDENNRDALGAAKHSAGAIYDYVAPNKKNAAQANVWHRAAIIVRGSKIEHWLDGEQVIAIDLATPYAQDEFATSSRGSREMLRKQERRRSPLALQIHDEVVCFRELKLKQL